jgi:hypothetical protein
VSGHPLQYAVVYGPGLGPFGTVRYDTDRLSDAEIAHDLHPDAPGLARDVRVHRYDRCPTCEQWSPCDVRLAATRKAPASHGG